MNSKSHELLTELCNITHLPIIDFDRIRSYNACLNKNLYIRFHILEDEKILISCELFSLDPNDLRRDLPCELLQTNVNFASQQGPWITFYEDEKTFALISTIDALKFNAKDLKEHVEEMAQIQLGMKEKIEIWRTEKSKTESKEKDYFHARAFLHSV